MPSGHHSDLWSIYAVGAKNKKKHWVESKTHLTWRLVNIDCSQLFSGKYWTEIIQVCRQAFINGECQRFVVGIIYLKYFAVLNLWHRIPENTRHWTNVVLMFGQRRRRLHNFTTTWLNLLCVCWHIMPIVAVLTTYRVIGAHVECMRCVVVRDGLLSTPQSIICVITQTAFLCAPFHFEICTRKCTTAKRKDSDYFLVK